MYRNTGTMADFDEKMESVLRAIPLPKHEGRLRAGQSFPDLQLTNEDGQPARPLGASGPLLLVFFRGFW